MLPDATDASAELDADATRRSFLKKVAIGGAVAAIGSQVLPFNALVPGAAGQEEEDGEDGAGGEDPTTETTQPGTEAAEGGTPLSADEAVMAFLAGLALAGAAVYQAATGDEGTDAEEPEEGAEDPAATTTTTTTLPPIQVPLLSEPVVEILRVFGSHHAQQAVALNGAISVAVEAPNGSLQDEIRTALGAATDAPAVLATLRQMEERLAATHLTAVDRLGDTTDASLVAAALPIVSQHAVVLGLISPTATPLEELVPELQTTDDAYVSTQYPTEVAPGGTPGDTDDDANAGGEGTDSSAGGSTGETPGDGTDSSGGGAGSGSGTNSGTPSDPESGS